MKTLLILLAFLLLPASVAEAERTPTPAQTTLTAPLNKEALASYISGRLKKALADEDYQIVR